jgi:hypothetical protein
MIIFIINKLHKILFLKHRFKKFIFYILIVKKLITVINVTLV